VVDALRAIFYRPVPVHPVCFIAGSPPTVESPDTDANHESCTSRHESLLSAASYSMLPAKKQTFCGWRSPMSRPPTGTSEGRTWA